MGNKFPFFKFKTEVLKFFKNCFLKIFKFLVFFCSGPENSFFKGPGFEKFNAEFLKFNFGNGGSYFVFSFGFADENKR